MQGQEFNIIEHDISFGANNSICGPCHVTIDRSREKAADAIMVKTGHLLKWQKVRLPSDSECIFWSLIF